MADGRVLLEVVVEGKNVKVVQREVEGVTDAVNQNTAAQRRNSKATNEVSTSHAHYDRGLKGVHQTNLSGAKSFSKIRDIIGGSSSGLVGAYATLAANLFAATAAFTTLQKAAQVEQLTQGLSALGASSGLAMGSLSKGLQEATGYAISLQDAMRSVAMVTSAGFDPSIIERLGSVAKNTSVALGRDLQDSMNRLVKGATKLEPELLDELGIMVRIDEATQQYAKEMGKTASQLTNFEKRQAFMNAVLAEGEKKFGAIGSSVNANPYDKLSAALQELSADILKVVNVILGPLIDALAESKFALSGIILLLTKGLVAQALPYFTMLAQTAAQAALIYSSSWVTANKKVTDAVNASRAAIASAGTKGLSKKQVPAFTETGAGTAGLKTQIALQDSIAARIKHIETMKSNGWKKEENSEKTLSRQSQQRYTRELSQLKEKQALLSTNIAAEKDLAATRAGKMRFGPEAKFEGRVAKATLNFDEAQGIEALSAFREGLGKISQAGLTYVRSTYASTMATTKFNTAVKIASATTAAFGAAITATTRVLSFALSGLMRLIPVVGWLMLGFDILKMVWDKLTNAFKSDALIKLEDQNKKLSETYTELKNNSEEVNKAFSGVSSSITTQTQAIVAQYNIITSANSEFKKSFDLAAEAGDYKDLIKNTQSLIFSNKALLRAYLEKINVQLKGKKISELSEKEMANFFKEFLQEQEKGITGQNAFNDALKDTGDQLTKYFNSLASSTPLDSLMDSFYNLEKALKSAETEGQKTGNTFSSTKAIIQNLGDSGLNLLGLSEVAKNFEQASEKAEAYKGIIQGFSSLKSGTKFWAGVFGGNDDVIAAANTAIDRFNKALPDAAKKIKPIDSSLSGQSSVREALQKAVEEAQITAENVAPEFKAAADVADKADKIIQKRTKQAVANYTAIYNKMVSINNIQTESNKLMSDQSRYALLTDSQVEARLTKEKELKNIQIDKNNLQIEELQNSINQINAQELTADSTARRLNLQEVINSLVAENGKLQAEQFIIDRDRVKTLAENRLKNVQTLVNVEKELLSILEKQVSVSESIINNTKSLQELELQLNDLRMGGSGELDVSQQLKLLKDFEQTKRANEERQYSLRLRAIDLEEKLSEAQLAVTRAQLENLLIEEITREAKDNSEGLLTREEETRIMRLMAELESAGSQFAASNLANLQREDLNISRRVSNEKDTKEVLQLERAVIERTYTLATDAAGALLNTAQSIDDIYSKINSAKTSILDNERTVRENELKAINLRERGRYELTAQQTLELEIEYADRKAALIKEEETRKLNMIDLEYALLEAQMRFQKFEMRFQLEKYAREASNRAANAAAEKLKPENKDPKIQAQLSNIITEANKVAKDLNETVIVDLENRFNDVIRKIPQLANLMKDQIRAETNASLSNLGAGVLSALQNSLNSFNPVITATVETNIVEMGQSFDATGLVQATAGAASAIVQNTIVTTKSKLEELGGDAATGARAEALRTVIDLEDKIAAKRKQLNEMTPEARSKAMEDTGAGSLSDLIAQQEKAAQSDPFTKMRAGAAALQTVMAPMIASLKTLGPQGELVAAIAQGSVVMADSFTTLADSTKSSADKFAAVGAIIASVSAIVASAGNARIANIDREINAEKKRDGKSKESLAKIAALEKKKEAVAKKNFEMNKKMQMAQVVMNAAAAIAGVLAADTPKMGVLAVPLAFAVGGLALAQLAIIAGTSYQGGGSGGGGGGPSSISVGERKSSIDMAKSQSAAGELGYLQGDKGVGGPENFRPAFIGSRAAGGRVNAGYMVGEQGPELFVPKVPGRIVPSDKINSAPAQNVNISISALDASGVEEVLVKQRGHIIGMIREAANSHGEKFLETVDTRVYTQPSTGYSGVARA